MLTQLILIMTPLGRLYVCVFVVNMSIAMMEAGVPRQEGSKSRDLGLDYFDLLARSLGRRRGFRRVGVGPIPLTIRIGRFG